MRRLPKTLRFLSQKYTVEVVPGLTHVADAPADHPDPEGWQHEARAYGVYTPAINAIYLDSENGRNRMQVTLMHESLHAMLDAAHCGIVGEEDIVGTLAPLLVDFIRQNKAAVAYMQES